MRSVLSKLFKDEAGAVTVDWVVLTAGVIGFTAVGVATLDSNSQALMEAAGQAVADQNDF